MRARPLVLLLLACAEAPERTLGLAEEEEVVEQWSPPEEGGPGGEGGADGASEDSAGEEGPSRPVRDCGWLSAEEPAEEGLELRWCARISPEEGEEESAGGEAAPPPCGFYNLVGSVSLAEGEGDPTLIYCDSDLPGGLRLDRYAVEEGRVSNSYLAEGSCYADLDTGALWTVEGGYLAAWVDLVGQDLGLAWMDAEGALRDLTVVPVELALARLELVEDEGGLLLLLLDEDEELWAARLSAEGELSTPRAVASGVRSFEGAAVGADVALAWCADEGLSVGLYAGLGGEAAEARWTSSPGSCDGDSRPTLASDGSGLALAWHEEWAGQLRFYSSTGEVAAAELGEDAIFPRVVWDGERYASVDGLGQLSTWAPSGDPLGQWAHPAVAGHAGRLSGLQLRAGPDQWTVLQVGSDVEPTETGHVNTFYYIELSALDAP